jgi:hypothetical protein
VFFHVEPSRPTGDFVDGQLLDFRNGLVEPIRESKQKGALGIGL